MNPNDFPNCPTNKNIQDHYQDQLVQLGISPQNAEERLELMLILNSYLGYPDDLLANTHRNANKLGLLDLKAEEREKMVMNLEEVDPYLKTNVRETRIIKYKADTCRCCGFFVQETDISTCSLELKSVLNLGSATRVFFKTFSFVAILLAIMTLVYSVFAFATNIQTARTTDYLNPNRGLDYLSISLGSKSRVSTGSNRDGEKYYLVSAWLGVAMLVIWMVIFVWIKRKVRKIEQRRQRRLNVSDYSIVIENMPTEFSLQELEKQLNDYLKVKKEEDFQQTIKISQIKIVKYNEGKPFYFNQSQFSDQQFVEIHSECDQIRNKIVSYVIEYRQHGHFITPSSERSYNYSKYKECQTKKLQKYRDIVAKLRQRINAKYQSARTVVFVTFLTHEQREFIIQHNKNTIFYKFKRFIQFWKEPDYFSVTRGQVIYNDIIIDYPPQPEDINWGNLGLTNTQKFFRFMITIFATIVMVGVSFVIVYALSTVQKNNQSKRFISILISLCISIINLLIIKVIQFMTLFQKVYSMNNYQISIAIKSIIAQSLNSIFVPIMVNYYIKDGNIFGVSGLAEDIFILGVASSFVAPIIRLIDPWNIFLALQYKWYHDQERRLYLTQFELNELSEKMQFQIGLEYIYLIHNFIFICFFVSLQPILSLFGLLSAGLMYWIQKHALLNRCQRPVPGPDNITSAIYQLFFFGPVAFALGNLTWSAFLPDQSFRNALVPNLIAAGLALIMFMFPYDLLVERQVAAEEKDYYEKRVYFTTEYDRLNPSTSREAIEQYRQFLKEKREQLHGGRNPQLQNEIINNLLYAEPNNIYKPNNYLNNLNTNSQERIIQQILYNQSRNVVNPMDLLNNLVPQQFGSLYRTEQPSKNPLNQLFAGRRGASQVIVGPSMKLTYQQEPSSKDLVDPNDMSIEQGMYNDDFKNVYHSNLRLDHVLGVTSKIVPDHPKKENHFDPRKSF